MLLVTSFQIDGETFQIVDGDEPFTSDEEFSTEPGFWVMLYKNMVVVTWNKKCHVLEVVIQDGKDFAKRAVDNQWWWTR